MPATPESEARTRAFAPIGPFLIVPGIIAARAPDMGVQLSAFFENAALVWITGALLGLCRAVLSSRTINIGRARPRS